MAAGKGTRMGSDLPKVLLPVADRPMIAWVVEACREAGVDRCILVVGHGGEKVQAALADYHDCIFVEQPKQLGTGHATAMARPLFEGVPTTNVFVLAGDAPLIRPQTLVRIIHAHNEAGGAATLATAILEDPTGYGRVIRDATGCFQAIVEQRDATEEQKKINEINPSYYCFRTNHLFDSLAHVDNHNAQHEYYLTDVPRLLRDQGQTVTVVDAVPASDVMGVNTQKQLAEVDQIMRKRLASPSYNAAR